MQKKILLLLFIVFAISCYTKNKHDTDKPLMVSENGHYFIDANGNPFFWLGDTGWMLFTRLTREESVKYLDNRKAKGFNVIQVMVLHTLNACNVYGNSALIGKDVSKPLVTDGSYASDADQYDYWDHVDYVIKTAAERQIYMALVPVWGNNVKAGKVNRKQAEDYARWIANRYKDYPNIIWLNGGDMRGSDSTAIWNIIGNTISGIDKKHLMTFHPYGRTTSSKWFQNEKWLDFNMSQSGHRTYTQDKDSLGMMFGEDNWRFIVHDLALKPVKPALDGEPSYEEIPYGLHDTMQPRWNANDVRRYAYWSVFAGACGFTYGHNSVMQFYRPGDKTRAYGAKTSWIDALNAPGARQMIFLKKLMESRPYFERVPDQSLVASSQGLKYDYVIATRGNTYAFIYTWTGRTFSVNMGKIRGDNVRASWLDPRSGQFTEIGLFNNKGVVEYDPPGNTQNGNDWVLVLDKN